MTRKRASVAALAVVLCLPAARAGLFSQRPRRDDIEQRDGLDALQVERASAIGHYAAGVSFELRGDTDSAIAEYLQSFRIDPHNALLATRLAQFYVAKKDYPKALEILSTATKAEPNVAELWFWQGLVYRTSEQNAKAVAPLQRALKLEPTHLNAMQTLLDIDFLHGATNDAVRLLERARQQTSTNWSYWARLGDIHALAIKQKPGLSGQLDGKHIRACYEKALALAPDEPDVLLRLAEIYTESQDFKKTAEIYAKLLQKRPDAPQIRERLAFALVKAEDRNQAIKVLEEIIKRDPLRYDIYNYLGELYEDVQRDDLALSNYQQSLVANPNQLPPSLRIVLLQMKQKHYADALKTLTAAKEKFPTSFQIPYFSGLAYSDMKQYDKAIAAFADAQSLAETATDDVKLDASFFFYFGAACERSGDLAKAEKLFRKSIEMDPEKHAAYNYLGYMWAEKGIHLPEALELIKKAVAKEPDNGAYLDSLGWVLFKLGRLDDALPQLRHAAELEKDDSTVFDHLADVLLKLGKRDEAVQNLRKAVANDPDDKTLAEKLKKLTSGK